MQLSTGLTMHDLGGLVTTAHKDAHAAAATTVFDAENWRLKLEQQRELPRKEGHPRMQLAVGSMTEPCCELTGPCSYPTQLTVRFGQ
jgi:hypothetical protein